MTEGERAKMEHALGLNRGATSYRNYFCAGKADMALWEGLVDQGFAERGPEQGFSFVTFYVTPAGRRALEEGTGR